MHSPVYVTKSDGRTELFDESKLVASLTKAGAPQHTVSEIIEKVENTMRSGISTTEIYRQAFSFLKTKSHPVAARYSIRRAMFELGPDGFPFEKFIARIFNMWGYEAITGQILMGSCVSHEVDVVAWKGNSLAMTEAKFHNEYGLKSDIKVALYVKARFDDLAGQTFEFGGKERRLTERYIFTNTKFSEAAIKYGECNGLKLISWDHPREGNLHNLIERNEMQPITCIASLTHEEKQELIRTGILLCSDLISNQDQLRNIVRSPEKIAKIMEESRVVLHSFQNTSETEHVSGASIGLPA